MVFISINNWHFCSKAGAKDTVWSFGSEILKYLVFNDPEWNLYDYDFSNFFKDTKYAASYLNSTSTDYREFKKNGGKMIPYPSKTVYNGKGDPNDANSFTELTK